MAEKTNDNNIQPTSGDNNQIVIYTTSDGKVNLEVQIDANTVWLTQQQIAQLYGKAVSTINEHIKNILAEEELKEDECVKKFGNSEFQQKAPFYYTKPRPLMSTASIKSELSAQLSKLTLHNSKLKPRKLKARNKHT